MPLDEEGAKWSCEPCIRGHRSSKCQHFDRLMMKVPKAGRPLAKCPHPKGDCSCQKLYAFMIRIPKGSTCLCRPLYKVPADVDETGQPTPPSSAVDSSSSSATPSKIQKSARRQSSLQAAPESIAKALDTIPSFQNEQIDESPNLMSSYPSLPPRFTSPHGTPNSTFKLPTPQVSQPASALNTGANTSPHYASCCSKKPQLPKLSVDQGSCCAKSNPLVVTSSSEPVTAQQGESHHASNGLPYSAFSAPGFASWQQLGSIEHGRINGTSMLHQTQPHNQVYANMDPMQNSHTNFPHQASSNFAGMSQAILQPAVADNSQHLTYQSSPTFVGDACHVCTCGDTCQCLGCASHPFNDRTKEHVQEMGCMVTFAKDGNLEPSNNYRNPHFSGKQSPSILNFPLTNSDLDPGTTQQQIKPTSGEQAPNSSLRNSNSNDLSSFSPEYTPGLLMEPEEYYTLEYPVGLPNSCSDVTGSCQCGNDCCCTGCLTHNGHNGEPATTDTTSFAAKKLHDSSSSRQTDLGLSQIPVLEGLSDPSLSPPNISQQKV